MSPRTVTSAHDGKRSLRGRCRYRVYGSREGSTNSVNCFTSILHFDCTTPSSKCTSELFRSDYFRRKEGNVLFNDALNTFYLRLYGVRHIVKDHSDKEKGNPLPPLHGLLLSINSKGSFICTILHTGQHIPRPLLHQSSWSTGWNEK